MDYLVHYIVMVTTISTEKLLQRYQHYIILILIYMILNKITFVGNDSRTAKVSVVDTESADEVVSACKCCMARSIAIKGGCTNFELFVINKTNSSCSSLKLWARLFSLKYRSSFFAELQILFEEGKCCSFQNI